MQDIGLHCLAALLIAGRVWIVGLCWTWILGPAKQGPTGKLRTVIDAAANILLTGTILNVLVVFSLGVAGRYTIVAEVTLLVLLCLAGLALCRLTGRRPSYVKGSGARSAGLLLLGLLCLSMNAPRRGEWIVGGWDPGVYLNEAIALEKTGTFTPPDRFFHELLTPEEQQIFLRVVPNSLERFPGVLLDSERQRFYFEFFRATPSVLALFCRAGGLHAAMRANLALGLFGAIVLLAFLLRHSRISHAVMAVVILVTQPIWIYHTARPLSEIFQLLLIFGLGFTWPGRNTNRGRLYLCAVLLFTAVLNRFSFTLFGALFVCLSAWSDLEEGRRVEATARHLLLLAALCMAALIDLVVAPASILGWTIMPRLLRMVGIGFCATILLDSVACSKALRDYVPRFHSAGGRLFALLATLMMAAFYFRPEWQPGDHNADNLVRLVPYQGGAPAMTLAVAGGWIWLRLRRSDTIDRRRPGLFISFLVMATSALLYSKQIVDWYPWATRRYMPYAIPLVSILAAVPLSALWNAPRYTRTARISALLLLGLLLAGVARPAWHAWVHTEYSGVAGVLAEAADQVTPSDILVADHPWWGTPFALTHQLNVLDGKRVWLNKTGHERARGYAALKRLRDKGYSILFFTSSEKGLSIYQHPIAPAELIWSSPPIRYDVIAHHEKSRDFHMKTKVKEFKLYRWLLKTPESTSTRISPGITN